jgi:hypothetical protein
MKHACSYCGYNSLTIVRDYTGAPYATCPRCYRANLLYRVNPLNPLIEKTAAPLRTGTVSSGDTGPGPLLDPSRAE